LLFASYAELLSFDAFNLVPELLTQPLQIIVGGRRGSTGQYEAGEQLYKRSPASEKDFFVIDGAGHYDLYHKPEYVDRAIDRLVRFYSKHLALVDERCLAAPVHVDAEYEPTRCVDASRISTPDSLGCAPVASVAGRNR
jgi:hypothetical protein